MCLQFATSVMVCGGYEDDADNGDELTYTGMTIPITNQALRAQNDDGYSA